LLVGVLLGANLVYFAMSRGQRGDGEAARALAVDAKPRASVDVSPPGTPSPVERVPVEVEAPPITPGAPAGEPGQAPAVASKMPARPASATTAGPRGLRVPVRGVAADALSDTYADARSEGRSHDAIDIMAPAGTPVIAVADGHVEKLFTSDRGGLTIYQFEPSGRYAYYYAHLDRYADGLKEGDALKQGEVIGYVGSTGNANDEAPHLHFGIFELGPERQWWKGTAINP